VNSSSFQRIHAYFLANISHEFRTPLSSLNASLEILLDETNYLSQVEQRELLKSVRISAVSLENLVNNLLESTSIEAGHFVIRTRPVNINQVLAEAVHIVQPMLDRRQQILVLTEPLRLPTLAADPVRLAQMFINLLSNASKYSPQRQKIDLGIDIMGEYLLIAVADRGPGVPESEHDDIFRHFQRLATEDSDQYGAGLGLSVVKSIVDGHRGTISIEDRPGGGSIFWITLPIGKEDSR
jgi:two-component system, OmpR family, sensor histidine kinase KdpD